jgi:hypothetical protein
MPPKMYNIVCWVRRPLNIELRLSARERESTMPTTTRITPAISRSIPMTRGTLTVEPPLHESSAIVPGKRAAFCALTHIGVEKAKRATEQKPPPALSIFFQESNMKRSLMVGAFALAVSLAASFGTAQIEIKTLPSYDQRRDAQWTQSRQEQDRRRQQKEEWQRAQWGREERDRKEHHQHPQGYQWWVQGHQHDYENRH